MKNILTFVLLLLLLSSTTTLLIAEEKNDNLEFSKDDEKVNILLERAEDLFSTNPKKALIFSQDAYKIARNNNDLNAQIKAVKIIANSYLHQNKYEKAVEYFYISLDIATELNDNKEKAFAYNNLGYSYISINDTTQAFKFLTKAIDQKKYFSEDSIFAKPYDNLANVYRQRYDLENAIKYSLISEEISERYNDKNSQAASLNNIGLLYMDAKLYNKALESFKKSKKLATEINNDNIRVFAELNIFYINIKYFNKTTPDILQGIIETDNIIRREKIYDAMDPVYQVYIEYFESTNNFKQALNYTNKYNEYKDSIRIAGNSEKLVDIKAKYESESKDIENEVLKFNNQLQETKLDKDRNFKIYLIIIILLVLIMLLTVIIRVVKFKKITKELKVKNSEIEEINNAYVKLNSSLENNVAEKSNELVNNIKELKRAQNEISIALFNANKANEIKDSFLSSVSQEIRTPLNAINGLTQLLDIEVNEKGCTTTTTNYVNGIKQSVNRLLNIFNNIIDFAKIESNEIVIDLTSCDLSVILKDVFELYRFKANEKDIDFILDLQNTDNTIADKRAISKVITDIFDNAIKFTDKGQIKITTTNLEGSNDVLIKVTDTGIGIENSRLPHVFDSVSEQIGESKKYNAAGLGLPLAKRLVEMMNGRIEISSMKGKGTTVSIYLQSENKSSIKNEISKNKRTEIPDSILKQKEYEILIVEDDEFNQLFLSSLVEKIAKPVVVSDSNEALKVIGSKLEDNQEFDLIFMDINLPGKLNGIELMQEIKQKWSEYEKVIFIAQTAYTVKKEKDKIINSGFNDYLSKPINTKELIDKIKIHLLS